MSSSPKSDAPSVSKRLHWMVTTNYRMRVFSLGMSFVGLTFELWGKASLVTWAALALIFLVYPHLAYWRACRAPRPHAAELTNLLVDSALIGLTLAALRFPLWLTFFLALGSSMNSSLCVGVRGLRNATAVLIAAALAGVAIFGFGFAPQTGWPTTVVLIIAMSAYLIVISLATYFRSMQLRSTREKLRLSERAISENNDQLLVQLSEIKRLQKQLNEQAVRDPLTGLFNRRYLETIIAQELARCAREGSTMALMMIDIDHFKSVNDHYGHQGGDEVLKTLARLLTDSVRASDVVCRFGGEEFLLLLPKMAPHDAMERAEQWRSAFANVAVQSNGAAIHATLSIGVAIHPQHGDDLHALVRAADLALYQAKAYGRNRVIIAEAMPALTP